MNIGDLFAKTLSANQQERESATVQLEQFAANDFPNYVQSLSKELQNETQAVHLRTAAGLALKNALSARDETRQREKEMNWIQLPVESKQWVKTNILSTLASLELRASTAAAQAISAVAVIEIPRNEWPDLMTHLLNNVTSSESDNLRQSTLQTVGFICESISPDILESHADRILTAVVQGARKEEPNQNVRLAALKALINSLDFVRKNFENSQERDYIMQIVCEATTSTEIAVVSAAFECLVEIMSLYYEKMAVYMQQALFTLTVTGMKSSDPRVSLQAIEFWSTVCEIEANLAIDAEEAADAGEAPEQESFFFARQAAPEIVPVILWLLTQQEEDADEDEWNPSMAAGSCLRLLSSCIRDEIVPSVLQFVEANVRNENWRYREAAVMAFGSILEGPQSNVLEPLVSQALSVVIEMMQDQSELVKDTTAWTLGRICELHCSCIRADVHMDPLMEALLKGLQMTPRVATQCAWALMNLASNLGDDGRKADSSPLSRYFEHVMSALFAAAQREDGNESNLRASAYEALSSMVLYAANDSMPYVQNAAVTVLDRLEASINMESQAVGQDDRNQIADLQMSLCGVVQNLSRKLGKEISPLADRLMMAFFSIFRSGSKNTTTIEDVFLAIGVLINILEVDFSRYMEAFIPFVYGALQNPEEYQLCGIAVGIVGDLSRGLGKGVLPYCNDFMNLLSQNLQSNVLHRDVKPQILSCFGDIALATMGDFGQYLEFSMNVLNQATAIQFDPNNDEMRFYAEDLFEGILEAYTGIVQGLKAEDKAGLLTSHSAQIFLAVKKSISIPDVDDKVIRASLGLLGDVASSFGASIKPQLAESWIDQTFKAVKANRNYSASTKEVLRWSRTMVKQATA